MTESDPGMAMLALAQRLWPFNRSISGAGLRATLAVIAEFLPGLRPIEVPSGSRALDWIVPEEWRIGEAWLAAPDGRRVADIQANNLHVVGYSTAVDRRLTLDALQPHLHSLPQQPDAIPYVTSYYHRDWGFCLADSVRRRLPAGEYHAYIDASHFAGAITLAELRLSGASAREILFSTYCCHPSLANNELSGPVLLTFLARWIASQPRRYSYRFVFLPEMIGSLAYLETHLDELRERVCAGFNVSCVGDERAWSMLPSRAGDTYADRLVEHVLRHIAGEYRRHHWRERGSDESNYCAPGVDLPVASLMRSKYGCYPEYHTSLDRLGTVVTATGLGQSLAAYQRLVETIEGDGWPRCRVLGEPQLGRRGLYPPLGTRERVSTVRRMLDLLSYSDGQTRLLDIANACDLPLWELLPVVDRLRSEALLDWVPAA